VRALFTEDCVLLPPHADKPRIGQTGLNEFWFPPGAPPTQITKLVVTPQSIGGDGQIAYVWGTDEVAWTTVQDGKTTHAAHKGIFLNVLRKQPTGEWKLSHHMWDDAVERR
jgi:ketosteroid isomerase-like protein